MATTDPGAGTRTNGPILPSPWPRRIYAVFLASICWAVLASHVHLGFERVRVRAVRAPRTATDATLRVTLPDLTALHGYPVAVIARVRGGDTPVRLRLAFDAVPVTDANIGAGDAVRIDGVTTVSGNGPHVLEAAGDVAGWRLEYLEIANLHGFSDGAISFILLPRDHPGGPFIPWWLALVVAVQLLVLGWSASWPTSRAWRAASYAGSALVLLLFGLALISAWVTPYRVQLSPLTFLLGAAVLYAAPLLGGLRPVAAKVPGGARLLGYAPHVGLAVIVLSGVVRFYDPVSGFTRLIMFGSAFAPRAVPAVRELPVATDSEYGYDGQFYAQLALDPLLRDPDTSRALDAAVYRARRVLVPAVAYVAGLGQPWPVLQAYALMNVACWIVLGWVLLRWLPPGDPKATLAWVGVMASHGLLVSMRLALSDGPSALLIAMAVAALESNRRWRAALWVALAGLAKETSLLAGTILVPSGLPSRSRAIALLAQGTCALAPFVIWIAYLSALDLPGDSGGARNFAAPFSAYAAKWTSSVRELQPGEYLSWSSLLTLVALTTQAVFLAAVHAWRDPWWRVGAGYAALMLVVGPAVWDGQPGAITRVILPMTVAFNILLPRYRWFLPLWILGNANLLHGPPELGLSWQW